MLRSVRDTKIIRHPLNRFHVKKDLLFSSWKLSKKAREGLLKTNSFFEYPFSGFL